MTNQYYNKVALSSGEVLIDLTLDDVKPEHVQSGISFHDKTGEKKQGTNTKTVDASTVTAEAAEVLIGKTFGKGSEIQTGTMPDNSGNNVEITSKQGATISRGFYDGATSAKISDEEAEKIIPENIKEGITILGVEGTFGADDISSQTKKVTPTFEKQIVKPDMGYSFLSSVEVDAIPISKDDNDAGGVTVTIG